MKYPIILIVICLIGLTFFLISTYSRPGAEPGIEVTIQCPHGKMKRVLSNPNDSGNMACAQGCQFQVSYKDHIQRVNLVAGSVRAHWSCTACSHRKIMWSNEVGRRGSWAVRELKSSADEHRKETGHRVKVTAISSPSS